MMHEMPFEMVFTVAVAAWVAAWYFGRRSIRRGFAIFFGLGGLLTAVYFFSGHVGDLSEASQKKIAIAVGISVGLACLALVIAVIIIGIQSVRYGGYATGPGLCSYCNKIRRLGVRLSSWRYLLLKRVRTGRGDLGNLISTFRVRGVHFYGRDFVFRGVLEWLLGWIPQARTISWRPADRALASRNYSRGGGWGEGVAAKVRMGAV